MHTLERMNQPSSKKPKTPPFRNRIGMKYGRIVLQVNTDRRISDMTSYF